MTLQDVIASQAAGPGDLPAMPVLIGVSGYAGTGKDTVAGFMAPLGFERRAFADAMKALLYKLDPIVFPPGWYYDGTSQLADQVDRHGWDWIKRENMEVRRLNQVLGMAGREMFGEDFWVNQVMKDLPARSVITDVRFPNEYDAIKNVGGEVWRIERKGFGPINMHASETALDGHQFDCYIMNLGTLDDLRYTVEEVVKNGTNPRP